MDLVPGADADGAVARGVRQGEGLIGFGAGPAGVVVAGDRHAVLAGPAFLAGPGDRVGVEHAAGCQPDQQVHGLPGHGGGQRGGAVPGVHDDQRGAAAVGARPRAGAAAGSGPAGRSAASGWRAWCARHRPARPRRCASAPAPRRTGTPSPGWSCGCCRSGRHRDGHDRGPASTRHRGGDKGWRRSRTAAAATVRTPPGPARPARPVPPRGLLQQAVVDRVVLCDPGQRLRTVNELRQRAGQQRGEGLLIDLPGGQRVIQRAVTAAELRHQRQLDQRGHRVIGTQDRIAQIEQRIRPRGQAPVQPGTELPQRHVPVNRAGHVRGIQGGRRHGRAAARRAAL